MLVGTPYNMRFMGPHTASAKPRSFRFLLEVLRLTRALASRDTDEWHSE